MQKKIVCRFSLPGFHYWPNPPKEYAYLGNPHRHLFFFEVVINLSDCWLDLDKNKVVYEKHAIKSNEDYVRELEFIELNNDIQFLIKNTIWSTEKESDIRATNNEAISFGGLSCEMIAEKLHELIYDKYRIICYEISVFEDNENGARLTWG